MASTDMANSRLFQPLKVGRNVLSSRLAMAPLTRFRADDSHVPLPMVAEYYAQRASVPGTLLVTEATYISPRAGGYANVPGIYTQEQIAGWKRVTDAVHAKGSYIYLQLWALGRAAKQAVLTADASADVVSSSDVPLEGGDKPTPIKEEDIAGWVADYAAAAKRAVDEAGFDGVEIHGANGYLPDQFLQDTSNKRTDRYGGSIENRSRFHLEISRAVVDAVGADRTGIRLSPWSNFQAMGMPDPVPQFSHLLKGLRELKLAYVHVTEPRVNGGTVKENLLPHESNDFVFEALGDASPVLVAGALTAETAKKLVDEERVAHEVVAVLGRYFISTPDLVYRTKEGIPWNEYDRKTFYKAKSPDGYIDYPFSEEFKKEARL